MSSVAELYESGGTERGGGTLEDPRVGGTVVSLRQTINGLPVITRARARCA